MGKGLDSAETSGAGRPWGECPPQCTPAPQCTAPPATTTTPPPTAASAAPSAPTSPSLVRTTASPAQATPALTSMAPPTSRTAKVGAGGAGRGWGARRGLGREPHSVEAVPGSARSAERRHRTRRSQFHCSPGRPAPRGRARPCSGSGSMEEKPGQAREAVRGSPGEGSSKSG